MRALLSSPSIDSVCLSVCLSLSLLLLVGHCCQTVHSLLHFTFTNLMLLRVCMCPYEIDMSLIIWNNFSYTAIDQRQQDVLCAVWSDDEDDWSSWSTTSTLAGWCTESVQVLWQTWRWHVRPQEARVSAGPHTLLYQSSENFISRHCYMSIKILHSTQVCNSSSSSFLFVVQACFLLPLPTINMPFVAHTLEDLYNTFWYKAGILF